MELQRVQGESRCSYLPMGSRSYLLSENEGVSSLAPYLTVYQQKLVKGHVTISGTCVPSSRL